MKFGIEEAKRAGEFADTEEQRRTVLAVARLFNIPIVIKEQIKARVKKLGNAISKKNLKINKLEAANSKDLAESGVLKLIREDWV